VQELNALKKECVTLRGGVKVLLLGLSKVQVSTKVKDELVSVSVRD